MSPWIVYTLLRLGMFAAAFAVLYVVLPTPLESAGVVGFAAVAIVTLIAAVIALTVSYIFFGRLRDAVALDLATRRERPADDLDAAHEDAAHEDATHEDATHDVAPSTIDDSAPRT